MDKETNRKINQYIDNEDWIIAESLLSDLLVKYPEDHWILTMLSSVYYEMKEYGKALELSTKSIEINPNCPLALSNHASILDMLHRETEAIDIWNILINKKIEDIAYNECGEGIKWANSLINDAIYRIGLCYSDLGNTELALIYFQKHLNNRKRGIFSNFTKKEVISQINNIRRNI